MQAKANFSLVAIKELEESSDYYEEKQDGLGERFVLAIYKSVKSIENNPEAYVRRNSLYREIVVDDFPYVVVYRYNKSKNGLSVTHVFHTSRNPKRKYRKGK